jgi:predicted acyl esterase
MRPTPDWHAKISQPVHDVFTDERDVLIPMRDGVVLTADVHRPRADSRFPALVAFEPWGKDHEALGNHFPHQSESAVGRIARRGRHTLPRLPWLRPRGRGR